MHHVLLFKPQNRLAKAPGGPTRPASMQSFNKVGRYFGRSGEAKIHFPFFALALNAILSLAFVTPGQATTMTDT